MAGPIERASDFLEQIHNTKEKNLCAFDRIRDGLVLMCWGLFQKMVIADCVALLVNKVYGNCLDYGFIELTIASLLFSVQIYCDFVVIQIWHEGWHEFGDLNLIHNKRGNVW